MATPARHARTTNRTERALAYARQQRQRAVRELQQLVRIPSVSAQPQHAAAGGRCAAWLAGHLQSIGLESVRTVATPRHPIVYGAWRRAPGRPTVLIYGHYDVQPADPLHQWHTPPFQPTIRDGKLYGRGASDDKGQLFAHIKAIEAYLRTSGELPVNVVCVFEGEEEIGSPNLRAFLHHHRRDLRADAAVISDTRFRAPGQPALIYALRGGLGLEVEVAGPAADLHSGAFGGAIHNPIQALAEMIARLHHADGRVAIPGFYDRVRRLSAAERSHLRRSAPPDDHLLRDARVERGWGERSYTLYERTTIRPALTINGISGGYTGSGGKAIIPARASVKLSFRLVPDQQPAEIDRLFRQYIARITPPTVRAAVTTRVMTRPALLDPRHPAMRAAARAYQRGFGQTPVLLRSGGSIPVVNMLRDMFNIPVVLMGFALPDDRMHAPNEKFDLQQFFRAIETCVWLLHEIDHLHHTRVCEASP